MSPGPWSPLRNVAAPNDSYDDEFAPQMEPVARLLLGEPNPSFSSKSELRYGTNGSLSVDLARGVYFDHENQLGGGVLALVQREKGFSNGEAVEWMRAQHFLEEKKLDQVEQKYIEATYDYLDESGQQAFQVVRFGFKDASGRRILTKDGKPKKTFAQRRKVGGDWVWNVQGVRLVPYRLPELLEALAHERPIFVAEGEKKVDCLIAAGVPATCNVMGAGKWPDDFAPHFEGANVIILPDNDEAGRKHAALVAEKLAGKASSVRILELPGLAEKGDVFDWLEAGHTANDLYQLVETTQAGSLAPRSVRATRFKWREPASIPRRQFIYGRHASRGFVGVTGACGGVGKTSLKLAESIALGTGRDLLGDGVPSAVPVWYLGLEDPLEEYERRVAAAALHYGISGAELEAALFLDSGRDQNFVIASEGPAGVVVAAPIVEAIIANVKEQKIGHIVVDPFVASHAVGENDNMRIEKVTREWARIAQVTNAAVELVHHLRKNGGAEPSADDVRGGSAVVNAARSVRLLTPMSKEEARDAGIDDRRRFFRVAFGKANMFLPAEAAEWRELKTVSLGNGAGGPDDEVQVATRWTWPNALDGLHISDLARVQERIASSEWAANSQADEWAGYAVAEVLNLDMGDKAAEARVKSLLKTWMKSGALKVERLHSNRDGRERPMIVVGDRT